MTVLPSPLCFHKIVATGSSLSVLYTRLRFSVKRGQIVKFPSICPYDFVPLKFVRLNSSLINRIK